MDFFFFINLFVLASQKNVVFCLELQVKVRFTTLQLAFIQLKTFILS